MWKADMNLSEVAGVVERYLASKSSYPQEWNDFIDTPQKDWIVDAYRKCCYELDPLINHDGKPSPGVVAALKGIAMALRESEESG